MHIVTFGGVTVGIMILGYQLVTWYPGRKQLMKDPAKHAARLLPFLLSWAYGCLITLGVGGLVGWVAETALWISNWLGDAALVWGVGGSGGQSAARATYLPLSRNGLGIALILTACFLAAVKKASEEDSKTLKIGAWCGITLGTSAGVAGFAAVPIAQAANWLGDNTYGQI